MPAPTQESSLDDMQGVEHSTAESSGTVIGDNDLYASQEAKPADSQNGSPIVVLPSTPAHSKPLQQVAAKKMPPPSQKPPRSGQGVAESQSDSSQPTMAAKDATSATSGADDQDDESGLSAGGDGADDPEDRIEDFDWRDLRERYHDRISELGAKEQSIYKEFESLCQYFAVWANVIGKHEVNRSYSRLNTRIAYVQHEEDELEQKRNHYIKVVEAFKSALDLLST